MAHGALSSKRGSRSTLIIFNYAARCPKGLDKHHHQTTCFLFNLKGIKNTKIMDDSKEISDIIHNFEEVVKHPDKFVR